jgi:electron transfer flavoprotein beta subunit
MQMKIVVAYKWAANPQEAVVDADGVVDWTRAKATVSEYDPVAIELGRQLADACGAELIGVSIGPSACGSPLARKAPLSRGLDRLVLVADDALSDLDTTTTGLAIAGLVKHIGDVDLIVTGDSSVDIGARLVPAVVAGALGWPMLSQVRAVSGSAGGLNVERTVAAGSEVLSVNGPAVLSIAVDAVVPRVPGMKDILASGKKPVEDVGLTALTLPDLRGRMAVAGRGRPTMKARKGQVINGADAKAAATAVAASLRERHAL